MPYHNPHDGPVIISAKAAFFRFPADAYSPAVWDETLAPYVAAAGLVLVASVPAGAVEAEISKTYQEATIHVDLVKVDVDALLAGIAAGAAQTQLALLGTGLPVPLVFADPGSNAYTVAIQPGRVCTRLRVVVGNSGVVISLDNGVTDSISLPPNTMDEIAVSLAAGANVRVRRYTAGVAMTDLVVEVR